MGSLFDGQTGVSYALPVDELLPRSRILSALNDVAFDHDPENGGGAPRKLPGYVLRNNDLFEVIFAAVGVAEIDHEPLGQALAFKNRAGVADMLLFEVRTCPR